MFVDCAVYEDGNRAEEDFELEHALERCKNKDHCFAWIGLHEPEEKEFESVRSEFDLHPLAVEDAIESHQRPKLEVYDDMLFVVLKTVRYDDDTEQIETGELLLFVHDDYLITVRHGAASPLKEVRKRLERQPDLLRLGPAAVLYAIVDRVVDDYEPAAMGVEQDIAEVEAEVFSPEIKSNPAERIFKLEREVLEFQRAVQPLQTPLDRLARGHFEQVCDELHSYFRDVHDHLLRVGALIDSHRQLLTSILQANLAQVTVRQNEDMRRVSAWAAILAVPTALAGIYGMNFEHMPELKWKLGYPLVAGVMILICTLLYRRLKRAGWL